MNIQINEETALENEEYLCGLKLTKSHLNSILKLSYDRQRFIADYLKHPLCPLKSDERKKLTNEMAKLSELDAAIVEQIINTQ